MSDKIWYAAYGSNMLERRFMMYIQGGTLAETGRIHLGARDKMPPEKSMPLWLPGTVYFAMKSTTWPDTGRALYDHYTPFPGGSAGRGYLITKEQFLDVVAQEMRMKPGSFRNMMLPHIPNQHVALGPGCYETAVCVGIHGDYPVITMAAPWKFGDIPITKLSGPYRDIIKASLQEALEWTDWATDKYLDGVPGGKQSDKD